MNEDYYCVLSGLAPQNIGEDEGDEFVDLPNGWLKITVQRRYENPKWVLLQQIKQASVEQMLVQVPEEERKNEEIVEAITMQVDSTYCAYEDKIGRYIVDEEIRYISDPSESPELLTETKKLFDTLELDVEDFDIVQEEVNDSEESESKENEENEEKIAE